MDDLNQLEKQMQPKIVADRDKENAFTVISCFTALCLAGIIFSPVLWLQIISTILCITSIIWGLALVFSGRNYET